MRKRALITGASSGIGAEIAKVFAKDGYDLILIARSNDKLDKLKNDLMSLFKIDVRVICADLTLPESPKNIYESISHLRVDVLVNNAGMGSFGEFYLSDLEIEEKLIMLNILALVKMTHLFIKDMAARRDGIVINIGSTAAFQPGPLMANYYASKAYVLSFTEAIAEEMKDKNVKVIAYCPGPTRTGFLTKAKVSREKALASKSLSKPRDIAEDIYKTMQTNKVVKVSDRKLKLAIFAERFAPRKVIAGIMHKIQRKRK